MIVRCLRILDPTTRKERKSSQSLTVGKRYIVLSIHIEVNGNIKFQVLRDDGYTPTFHAAEQFDIMSSKIPDNWHVDFLPGSYFSLCPKAWARVGFWDDYFDGDPEAEAIFDREKEAIFSGESGADK